MVVLVSYTRSMLRVKNQATIKAISGNMIKYQRILYRKRTMYLNKSIVVSYLMVIVFVSLRLWLLLSLLFSLLSQEP